MKSPLPYAVLFVSAQLGLGVTGYSLGRRLDREASEKLRSVSDYEAVLKNAKAAEERVAAFNKQGANTSSYQMFLQQRSDLAAKLRAVEQEMSVQRGDLALDHDHVDVTFSGSTEPMLKFLSRVEETFPELRQRSVVWAPLEDGRIQCKVHWDLWPIPKPILQP